MKTQIRISRIIIEIPRLNEEIWIHVVCQEVKWDDEKQKVLSVVPRTHNVHTTAKAMAKSTVPLVDPFAGGETISGYGVHLALKGLAIGLMQDKFGGTVNDEYELWLT
ncbi:MAG: hypothetical protein DRI46_06795 [Chloroflexi bacterium]|nr:MAG: hypothetical protein DRI46_06795 [Chloroflexota bacterium]